MIYNITGLIFDLLGVILLFKFGILPDNLWKHIIVDNGMSEKDENRHKIWSKVAIIFIFIGFTFQLLGSFCQNTNSKSETLLNSKNLYLGVEKNQTSGLIGTLKLKYNGGRMFYQLQLIGSTSSFEDISKFFISIEDKDGFEIKEIGENNNADNNNLSRLFNNDNLKVTIKGSIPFSYKEYSQIGKWNLKISK